MISRVLRIGRRWRDGWIIRRSGLWDAKWYVVHNPDVASSGEDPLRHYVRHGAAERRSPGSGFDAYGYWLLNPTSDPHPLMHYLRRPRRERHNPLSLVDPNHPVLSTGWFDPEWYRQHRGPFIAPGAHPYIDYVQFGEKVGTPPSPWLNIFALRDAIPAEDAQPCLLAGLIAHGVISTKRPLLTVGTVMDRREVLVPRAGRPTTGRGSVLVVVHGYYEDVLPEILSHIAHVPAGSTVAIVVPDADRVEGTYRVATEILGTRHEVRVVVGANRGRNFGPLVTDLVPLIRDHDYLLHVHTKKSLYTGTEQDRWRHHLTNTLVGSPALVDTILGVMDDDPSVGIIYPSTFDGLAPWAHHWLGNVGAGRELYRRIGLDPGLASGIVDYPAGGMFWARTRALERLWNAGLRPEDFPAEPVGDDGTLAHAIERSIVDIARSDGFDVVEVDVPDRIWRRNWSGRRPLPSRSDLEEQIVEALADADLVTVDLFDTLVLRPSLDAGALQRLAAMRVGSRYGISPEELLRLRLTAEADARQVVAGDVRVDDICAAAPEDVRSAVTDLIDAEIDLEADVCIPRPWLIDLLRRHRRADRPMVLMSDSYLPRSCLDDLIHHIGCDDLFDEVLLSNEIRARKDSGTMWDLVEQRYRVPRDRWLHLGDNEHSDVQVPRDRGINGLHVPTPHSVANFAGMNRRSVEPDRRLATDLVLGLALTGLYGEGHTWWDSASAARRFGWAGIGPMLWTYVSWLVQHPATRAADRILFVARDGYLSQVLLERLRPILPARIPPSAYLLTSRCCALSIAQAHGVRFDLLLGPNTWTGSIRDLVRHRVGVDLPNDPVLDEHVELPADRSKVTEVLDRYSHLLVEQGARDRAAFEEYMGTLGIRPGEKLILSDLGYSGTIQRCLESVLPYTFTGLYAATTPAAAQVRGATHGVFGESVTWPHEESTVMEQGLLLEAVWAADHGQVIRIERTPEGPSAQLREPDRVDDDIRRELREIQDAAIDFCVEVVERFGSKILDLPVDPLMTTKPLADLVSGRIEWANDVLEDLLVEGDFTGVGSLPVRTHRR